MKKVDLLVLKAFFGPFLATFFVVEFVFIMQFFYVYIDDFIGKGLPWYIVAQLIAYLSANTVPLALPLAILLSAIMTFGNLGERYELIALKTAGISMRRTAAGLFAAVIVMSLCSLAFSNYVVPTANLKFWTTLIDISRSKPALNIKENIFYKDIEPYIIKVDHKDPDGRHIAGITIRDYTDYQQPHNIITAERGEMYATKDNKYLILKLYNGAKYETLPPDPEQRGVSRHLRTEFSEMEKVMDLSGFELTRSKEDQYRNQYQMLDIGQLKGYVDSLEENKGKIMNPLKEGFTGQLRFLRDSLTLPPGEVLAGSYHEVLRKTNTKLSTVVASAIASAKAIKSQLDNSLLAQWRTTIDLIRRSKIELHRKYTSAFACAVLFLIGAPFGAVVRKGGLALPVIAATILYILFLILYKLGESLGKNGTLDPVLGMWAPPLLMVPIAALLVYKANTDAAVLQLESYRLGGILKAIFRPQRP
jgi:lipopolysaccharide export system permease protein